MAKQRIALLAALWTSITLLGAQDLRQVPYFHTNQAKLKTEAADRAKATVESAFSAPDKFDKEAKKAFLEERQRMGESVAEVILETALFDNVLHNFLKDVHQKIRAANPGLPETNIILTSEPVPNAFSVGDGTIVVYTGLISELENEDQLAFVLCHEIAHFTLKHATNQLIKEIERFQSKEFKAQIKKIKETEYNQSELYETMYRNVQFKSRYHRRDLERQADSLAYQYYLNTSYSPSQALRLQELFETIDESQGDSLLQLDQHFGCTASPFQPKWKENGSSSIWGAAHEVQKERNKAISDSLSTHPDAKARYNWIAAMAAAKKPVEHPVTINNYEQIRFLCALENVQAYYDRERYDKAIYKALLYQKAYPACAYFKEIVALSLNGLFVHLKNHNLSAVLSQTSPYYDYGYNGLLSLLNNLRLSELTALQACVLEAQPDAESEFGLYAAYKYAVSQADKASATLLQKKYLQMYPQGRFVDAMDEK
jgi:Peptidase family M48